MKYFHRPGHSPAGSRRAIVSYKPKNVHTSTGLSPLFYACTGKQVWLLSYFFEPEVQRAWHMLILSPICYR